MLKVPELDDLTYEQIIQRAVSRIPSMTEQWTDYNSHDPGITVLQTYAWLTDMLDYYMNATGDVHVEKYLKLLGIEPEKEKPASGYAVVSRAFAQDEIPAGTKLLAGDVPFETVGSCRAGGNRFCVFLSESDGRCADLTAFAGRDGDYAECFASEMSGEQSVYLGFERPLSDGDGLYVCVQEDGRRAPFGPDFRLCGLRWQVCTEEGFVDAQVSDGTCGFLKSGFVRISLPGEMKAFRHPEAGKEAYFVRCTLEKGSYDIPPRLGMIYVNPIEVVQKRTVCREGDLKEQLRIGQTDGCAEQELLFDYPNVMDFSLLLAGPQGERVLWRRADHWEQAGYEDRIFSYDRETQTVRFGDGLRGAVPPAGWSVHVTGLTCSLFQAGNVQAGELKSFADPERFPWQVSNPMPLQGGRDRERLSDMLARMESSLFAQRRMASEEDYERIVRETPGLMIELVHVIPGTVYGQLYHRQGSVNEVVLAVKPWSRSAKPELGERYRRAIERHVEPYRLLNMKVSVVSPVYVGVEAYGRIGLWKDTQDARERVRQCLREAIDYTRRERPFGAVISYGRLFTRLEMLEGVSCVYELNLEQAGSGASKNSRGDILLHEDALSCFEKMEIEFVEKA
ncbi:MAG: baseplate J/gp47 family protein [Eubacteriales bacterium]|nr:baseplate J/gp47 family protein [Eubacteriales bacterium]